MTAMKNNPLTPFINGDLNSMNQFCTNPPFSSEEGFELPRSKKWNIGGVFHYFRLYFRYFGFIQIFVTIILSIILFDFKPGYCQPSGKIYNNNTQSDTVYLGMCLVGDSLQSKFTLENTGDISLTLGEKSPSYILGMIIGHPQDFEEFSQIEKVPFELGVGINKPLTIQYNATNKLPIYPVGIKMAMLKLGIYDSRISPDEVKESDLVTTRRFILIAKKTSHYIDCFDDLIVFDSVYINPNLPANKSCMVQNNSNFSLNLDSQKIRMLSPILIDSEFSAQKYNYPLPMPSKKNTVEWQIYYSPKDMKGDSAYFELYYLPQPDNPTKTDTVKVKLTGIGVKQKLEPDSLKSDLFIGDTLDFGEVRLGSSKEFIAVLTNKGNIPLSVLSQDIYNQNNELATDNYSITQKFRRSENELMPNQYDSVKILFTPTVRGQFLYKYVIKSDIFSRHILSLPKNINEITFYLKGKGVEPQISILSDKIDFGNIVISPECSNSRDTLIPIANIGNTWLKIKSAEIFPPIPISKFRIVDYKANIEADSSMFLKLNFSSGNLGQFTSRLLLTTNSTHPLDSIWINLSAEGVEPMQVDLRIPTNIEAKPGRNIVIPILAEQNKIIKARTFHDTLTYDRTTLVFEGFETVGTSSEGAPYINIGEVTGGGRAYISISMPSNSFFLKRDTLIVLKFKSYLGEKNSTEIAFADPHFGDGICDFVLTPKFTNGLFSLDSVCGLELKTVPLKKGTYRFEAILPNPVADKFTMEYELPYPNIVGITIYDSFGNQIRELLNNYLPAGFLPFGYILR